MVRSLLGDGGALEVDDDEALKFWSQLIVPSSRESRGLPCSCYPCST